MKRLILLGIGFLLLTTTIISHAEKLSFTASGYTSYQPFWSKSPSSQTEAYSIGVRNYFHENGFVSLHMNYLTSNINLGIKNAILPTVNIGYKSSGRVYFDGSIGIGILSNTDTYLGNNRQFEIGAGVGYKINNDFNINFKVTHFSSCSQICGFNQSETNKGKDYFGLQLEFKI